MNRITSIAAAGLLSLAIHLTGCSQASDRPMPQDSSSTTQPSAMSIVANQPNAAVALADAPVAPGSPASEHQMEMPAMVAVNGAIAVLQPLENSGVSGTITFTQVDGGIKVVADVMGLSPGKHGFHVHEFGDASDPKGMSAGGHFNPEHMKHGLPDAGEHHPGDMGNLEADASGKAHLEITMSGMTINGAKDAILGRSVIIHEKADDGGQPTGNAGGRIAIGIIGVAKPK